MIETRLLVAWDGFVGLTALIAIIALAFCVMMRTAKLEDIPRHLGVIIGIVILFIMLPAIIVSLWNSMTLGQHLGIATVFIGIIFLISAIGRRSRKARH